MKQVKEDMFTPQKIRENHNKFPQPTYCSRLGEICFSIKHDDSMVPITRYAWHCAIVIIESYKKAFTLHYVKKIIIYRKHPR